MHDPADRVRLSLDEQMHMVGHQTVGVEKEWEPHLQPCEQRKELLVVRRRVEYPPTIIAASDHMVQTALDFSASFPGHGPRMLTPANARVNGRARKDFASHRSGFKRETLGKM